MRFIYKINSAYNGFTPAKIPDRLRSGRRMRLSWTRYIDIVESGHQVWVYFRGPHNFAPGVYLKGVVTKIDARREHVTIRVKEWQTDAPLTDVDTSRRLAKIVNVNGRQVFLLRREDRRGWFCTPERCADHRCGKCPVLKSIPLVGRRSYAEPRRLSHGDLDAVVPAFWIVPSRCYLPGRTLKHGIVTGTELFYSFKAGERALAYPFARSISRVLRKRRFPRFDCIVPIPLSPDKIRKGELHRTRELARELSQQLNVPVVQLLSLKQPISKRRILARGHPAGTFRRRYRQALSVRPSARSYRRILLLDDVCTHGNTLAEAARTIREVNEEAAIVAVTVGQMIVKECVLNKTAVLMRTS